MVKTLLFDALVLATVASLVGLALGEVLSTLVFGVYPGIPLVWVSDRIERRSSRGRAFSSRWARAARGVCRRADTVAGHLERVAAHARIPSGRPTSSWLDERHADRRTAPAWASRRPFCSRREQSAVARHRRLIVALLLLLPPAGSRSSSPRSTRLATSLGDRIDRDRSDRVALPTDRGASIAIAATAAIAVFGSVTIQGRTAQPSERTRPPVSATSAA